MWIVGGAIKAVYRRGGTVGVMVGGTIKAVYGRGVVGGAIKGRGVVGGAIRTLYRRGGTVGGNGGWSNQSSDAHVFKGLPS